MNIKKVDDKPMVIHTKEKPKLKVKGAPETKIKGRNVLTVQHGPKTARTVTEKSVAADGKIKLKRSSVHVTDKRKTVQTKTAADGMEYRGRNGGGTVQDRKGNGTAQGRNVGKRTMFVAFLGLFHKVYACGMLAGIVLSTTKVSEFLSAMNRIHAPKKLVIPLAVMLRYIPTIQEDWHFIKDAMRMRDVSPTPAGFLKNLGMTIECIYVPLMMAASKAADELSIASGIPVCV